MREALLEATSGNVDAEIIDFFKQYSPTGAWLTSIYNYLLRHSIWLNTFYIRTLHLIRPDRWKFFYKKPLRGLRRLLLEKKPDILILTSQYIVSMIGYGLSKTSRRPITFVGNIDPGTSCVPLWFDDRIDFHLIPTTEAMQAYRRYGFDPKHAIKAKLNIRKCFLEAHHQKKEDVRRQYGWVQSEFVVLFAGSREGYMGVIPMVKSVGLLNGVRIVAICGTNGELLAKLQDLAPGLNATLEPLGWRDDVHLLMRGADAVIAKPGKQTMKETLAVGVPLIPIDFPSVMQQELGNLEYLENREVLLKAGSIEGIANCVLQLRDDCAFRNKFLARLDSVRSGIDPSTVARCVIDAYRARLED